jgi:hypothetical protein
MWLPRVLRDALESLESAQNLAGEVQGLRDQVAALEALQLEREGQWTETKAQVFRHLKRIQATKGYDLAQEENGRPSAATVLAMKYRNPGS